METLYCSKIFEDLKSNKVCMEYFKIFTEVFTNNSEQKRLYGIKIKKYINDKLFEEDCESRITEDERCINSLISSMANGMVTPSSFISVIDDFIV